MQQPFKHIHPFIRINGTTKAAIINYNQHENANAVQIQQDSLAMDMIPPMDKCVNACSYLYLVRTVFKMPLWWFISMFSIVYKRSFNTNWLFELRTICLRQTENYSSIAVTVNSYASYQVKFYLDLWLR